MNGRKLSLAALAAWFGLWAAAAALAARLAASRYPPLIPVCLLLAMANAAAAAGLAGYRKWGRWVATALAGLGLAVPLLGTLVNAAILWLLWRKEITAALNEAEAERRARLPWLREYRAETRLCLAAIVVLAMLDLVLWARYTASAGAPRTARTLPAATVSKSRVPTRVPPTRTPQPTRVLATLPPKPTQAPQLTRAPAAAATVTPDRKPASPLDGSALLSDDFSGPVCLATLSNDKGEMGCEDGEFSMLTEPAGLIHKAVYDLAVTSYTLEADARVVDGPDQCCYGLVFGWQVPDDFYYFWVSADGYYALQRRSGGQWQIVVPLEASTHIRRGKAANHVRIEVDRGKVTLSVNGHELATVAQTTQATTGRVGLASGTCLMETGVHVHFDNVQVYSLPAATSLEPAAAPRKAPASLSSGAHGIANRAGLARDDTPLRLAGERLEMAFYVGPEA